jgi:beta-glucanase (GH16 family)
MGVLLTWPESDRWPVDGEIDLLETPGTEVMHTSHGVDASGNHYYDSVRNEAYDETQWCHYKLTWLPDYMSLEVNGNIVAEWTDPALIPDTAHGIGAMVNVASPNDSWMGPPPNPNGPGQMVMEIDNVRMYQATDAIL